jgi:hypothetical protein
MVKGEASLVGAGQVVGLKVTLGLPLVTLQPGSSGLLLVPFTTNFFAYVTAEVWQATLAGKLPRKRAASRTDLATVACVDNPHPKSTPPAMRDIATGKIMDISTKALPDEQRASRSNNLNNDLI